MESRLRFGRLLLWPGLTTSWAQTYSLHLPPLAAGPFRADWNSLTNYQTPEWFRDAKFGVCAHWGSQCRLRARVTIGFALTLGMVLSSGMAFSSPESRMTFLDNGEVRIGMDLALGGAVTFISSKDRPGNIINSADLGRQIQMSHYSGPWPFEVGSKKPNPGWAGLGWNPSSRQVSRLSLATQRFARIPRPSHRLSN